MTPLPRPHPTVPTYLTSRGYVAEDELTPADVVEVYPSIPLARVLRLPTPLRLAIAASVLRRVRGRRVA